MSPPLEASPASKHAPTAQPFVERFYWLVRLQEVRGDWLAEGRPLKRGRGRSGFLVGGGTAGGSGPALWWRSLRFVLWVVGSCLFSWGLW